ncbi:MAG: M23 family metallopeptidase [Oscillospiraceae bacterium]|jgi:murein DD-endopeptidase MepM/ murein hydrolase activator NlpD|nr:M23 family metallopeptidase [Oscillospiraceae bacterium]
MDRYDSAQNACDTESRYAEIRASRAQRRQAFEAPDSPFADVANGKKGSYTHVVLAQILVCAILLGAAFCTTKIAPNTYRQLRASYQQMMKTDMTAKEVWAHVKAVFSSLKEEIYVIAPADEPVRNTTESGVGGKDVSIDIAAKNCTMAAVITTVAPKRPIEKGRLTSSFGVRIHPVTQTESFHTGMDIGADMGAPIAAAFYGTVAKAAVDPEYGNFVLLNHKDGMQTLYAHCSELLVEAGMVIRAGEVIALVGSTGVSNGPHLHFEIRINGVRADPAPLFGENGYQFSEK